MAESLRYHAVRKIADGGSAEVFLGEQQGAAGFKRPVVLKRIRPELYADAQYREMLIEEARLSMSLHHSNLVEVLDVGESAGKYFLVMELVDGWTLHQVMRRARDAGLPLPPELAVYITAEVCRALAYAHARSEGGQPLGIVHRDVCPNNVLVSMHAEVKLTDFGIARARTRSANTKIGMIKGKPAFMSPEQTRAEPLDARSDLFSVGTVLYALLTDKLPFMAPSDHELLLQVSGMEVPSPATLRPELPKELCKVVLKAMAKKREERFQSAQEMLSALEQVQRTALRPAGRSELENFLRTLSAKDGARAISQETMPPAAAEEPVWIALSAENPVYVDQTATQKAMPLFDAPAAPRRRPWVLVVSALLVLLGGGWWLRQDPSEPGVPLAAVVDAGAVASPPAPVPVTVVAAAPDAAVAEAPKVPDEESEWVMLDDPSDEEDAGVPAVAEVPAVKPEPASRSGTKQLRLSARLAAKQKSKTGMVGVVLESEPPGVVIRVDRRELGRTPATLYFKKGLTFDVWFEAKGKPPLRQWLMLTEREGKPPKVTLRNPVP